MSEVDQVEVVDGEPVYAVVPWTGEAMTLPDMSMQEIAYVLDEVAEFKRSQLADFERAVKGEVLRRMDAEASWTAHVEGGWKITADSPARTEWDVDKLIETVESLVGSGHVSPGAADKALKVKVVHVPSAAGLNALCKLGGEVKERIESCRLPSSKPRGVRVSRDGL